MRDPRPRRLVAEIELAGAVAASQSRATARPRRRPPPAARARGERGGGPQHRRLEARRQLGELGAGRPGSLDVAGGEEHLDRGRQHRRAGAGVGRSLVEHAVRRGDRVAHPALREPEERQARHRVVPERGSPSGTRARRRRARRARGAARPVGRSRRRARGGRGRTGAGAAAIRLGDRLAPLAARLQHLRAVHEALPPVRHQVGLRRTPATERLGPLRGAAQVEGVHATLDHRAVDDARRHRRHLVGAERHHDLVEEPHAAGEVAGGDRRLAAREQPERQDVAVAEPPTDRHDLLGRPRPPSPESPSSSAASTATTSARPRAGHAARDSSIIRSGRASQPLPTATSPRSRWVSDNQHAAPGRPVDVARRSTQARCAASQAPVLSSSRPRR